MEERMCAANFICCQLKLTGKLSQQFLREKEDGVINENSKPVKFAASIKSPKKFVDLSF
jgi:hypothetical protein